MGTDYKNSTHTVVWRVLSKERPQLSVWRVHRHKLESTLNTSAISSFNDFSLMFKGSEDKATNRIENWPLIDHSTVNLRVVVRETYRISAQTLYRRKLEWLANIVVAAVWQYLHLFSPSCFSKQGGKIRQTDNENRFWHKMASQGFNVKHFMVTKSQ